MFELREPPFTPWTVLVSPSLPGDLTPDLVREYVAAHPGIGAVELSGAFLRRRPGSDPDTWRRLDQELGDLGIEVFFGPGGCATWEARFSVGANTTPKTPLVGAQKPVESVTQDFVTNESQVSVLQGPLAPVKAAQSVPPSSSTNDEAADQETPLAPVTPGSPVLWSAQPVLQPLRASACDSEGIPVEVRVQELGAQGLSTRRIAAALHEGGYASISHMTVARHLARAAQMALRLE